MATNPRLMIIECELSDWIRIFKYYLVYVSDHVLSQPGFFLTIIGKTIKLRRGARTDPQILKEGSIKLLTKNWFKYFEKGHKSKIYTLQNKIKKRKKHL